jgi:hypothetical protein
VGWFALLRCCARGRAHSGFVAYPAFFSVSRSIICSAFNALFKWIAPGDQFAKIDPVEREVTVKFVQIADNITKCLESSPTMTASAFRRRALFANAAPKETKNAKGDRTKIRNPKSEI